MNPGTTQVITVAYKNTGNTTAYSAHATITPEDPFITTNNDDTAYIGDLPPGSQERSLIPLAWTREQPSRNMV